MFGEIRHIIKQIFFAESYHKELEARERRLIWQSQMYNELFTIVESGNEQEVIVHLIITLETNDKIKVPFQLMESSDGTTHSAWIAMSDRTQALLYVLHKLHVRPLR